MFWQSRFNVSRHVDTVQFIRADPLGHEAHLNDNILRCKNGSKTDYVCSVKEGGLHLYFTINSFNTFLSRVTRVS